MTTLYPTHPRLHALLGNALPGLALPNAVAEALEDALIEAAVATPPSAFFARLRGVAQESDDARGRGLARVLLDHLSDRPQLLEHGPGQPGPCAATRAIGRPGAANV